MLSEKKMNQILAAIVFLISTFVYFRTIAPTTSFWDCGEFIACSYILGVPHPPGAPLYILVGRIFTMIPFADDIGLRVNAISALASGLTIMFLYLIIVRLIKMWRGTPENTMDKVILFSSGMIGALLFAFTDTTWFNAVEAEVYAISLFFTAIIVWLILIWYEKADDAQSERYILMIAYCVGLAIGVHLLNILALPAIGLIIYFRKAKFRLNTFFWFGFLFLLAFISIYPGVVKWLPNLALKTSAWLFVAIIAGLVAGLYYAVKHNRHIGSLVLACYLLILLAASTYISLFIRSNLNPQIDENDPETLQNMVSYLNREQYGDWSYIDRRAPLWEYQIEKMYLRYFGWQFIGQGTTLGEDDRIVENYSLNGLWGLPFLVGLIGMFRHFRKDWKHASSILLLFILTGLAIVLYLNQEDPQPRERDYVYVGSFFAFAIWIGIGVSAILEWLKEAFRKMPRLAMPAITVAVILLALALPIRSLALHYHSHDRTGEYVAYDYSYNILQSCEPDAVLFTNGDNDTFPLWFLQYVYNIRTDIRVVNLSLLNTSWYIKQLKAQEPRVPISLSDAMIDDLGPRLLPPEDRRLVKIPVPPDAYARDLTDVTNRPELLASLDNPPEISFTLKPTIMNQGIRVQDIMVLNIIQSNRFRKPIYFALTVSRDNQLNMFKYLRMDGLVFKLITYPNERISPSRLHTNLFEKFQYRGLNDPSVHFNHNIKGLLRNYHGAYFSLAQHYLQEKLYDRMDETFKKLNEVMPDSVITMSEDLKYNIGFMYYQAGQNDEFKRYIDSIMKDGVSNQDDKLRYASIYHQLFRENDKAESLVKEVISNDPAFAQAYYWLLSFYTTEKRYDDGMKLLNGWLEKNPDDKVARNQQERLRQLLAGDTTSIDSIQ